MSVRTAESEKEIEGRNLLLVDDILDTGRTMSGLKRALLARGAGEVRTCVFLDKPARRDVVFDADYRAFEVENLFVVGYGLDFDGKYRNLPHVASLRSEVYAPEGSTSPENRLRISCWSCEKFWVIAPSVRASGPRTEPRSW